MTPVKSGATRRLGLRLPPPPWLADRRALDTTAHYEPFDGHLVVTTYEWIGHANGCTATYTTTDPDLKIYVHSLRSFRAAGVALADQNGRRVALQVQQR